MILTRKLFRTGLECPRKLLYAREHFPADKRIPHESFFALAEWAPTLFTGTEPPPGEPEACRCVIATALERGKLLRLRSPGLLSGRSLAQPAIVEVSQGQLIQYHLTEKTINSAGEEDPIHSPHRWLKAEWRDILADAAFDASVLEELFPEAERLIRFILPDRAAITQNDPGSQDPREPGEATADFLVIREVTGSIEPLIPGIREQRIRMEGILSGVEAPPRRGLQCRNCEFDRTGPAHPRAGFDICWDLPRQVEPEILWLSHVAHVDETSGGVITRMIREGRRQFSDLPRAELKVSLDERQDLQLSGGAEALSPAWRKEADRLIWPLYFVDFEIARTALPLHRGMRPQDRILFQWSCHRLDAPEALPVHRTWLNESPGIPNIEFAASLMDCLGRSGSILTWSRFENSQIRYLHETLETERDPDLKEWLGHFDARSVDMEEWARRFYHHPEARGRTSLKRVLGAAFSADIPEPCRQLLRSEGLYRENGRGGILNPYGLLEGSEAVKQGTGAVSAYLDMVYGRGRNDEQHRRELKEALIRYCRLDTLAMLLLWLRFNTLSEKGDPP